MPARPLAGATIVFDLDGTLVDTAPDIAGALNGLLIEEGLSLLDLERTKALIGGGVRAAVARGFGDQGRVLDEPSLIALCERFTVDYRARIAHESRPYPGASAALDRLAGDGARLAVCTNKRADFAVALLTALGLRERFAAVVTPATAGASKPDPAHLLAAIARAGGRADRAVMVGDSAFDAAAARAAGVPLVLVDFGYSETPARDLAPDVLISHFDALPAACARLLGIDAEVIAACPEPDA